jgi:hypothetical protein
MGITITIVRQQNRARPMSHEWPVVGKTETQFLLLTLQQISTSLAQLVLIEQKRLENELNLSNTMAIQADSLNTLLDLVNATLAAKSAEDQTVADLKAQVANDAAIADPALQAKFDATLAALAAATPSPAAPPPVVDPNAPPTPAP